MKVYRVFGWNNGKLVSVYDELIKASCPAEAVRQAVQWNLEESCTGRFNARYNRIEYFDEFGKIENTITQIAAIAR